MLKKYTYLDKPNLPLALEYLFKEVIIFMES